MVKLLSTTLSTVPAAPAMPVSLNTTSLVETGGPLGVQLPAVDQFVLTPAGVQIIIGVPTAPTTNVYIFVTRPPPPTLVTPVFAVPVMPELRFARFVLAAVKVTV